ncbi:uncharacterized protein LOC106153887 [Lingula anatina]|uniref:Uncharacterized protein LOC106153887 n=1 Tax=Lingula anatina TaxID=7574 RepID=A0A1S3HD55_LINAN|nr:uncharacterized protein LOC106153887 [Lingula anatina]XP_013383471.1 uncharacterized protein LOC106153887 [Lingula anatina]|eukprot:XP_013383470.1 uncharacterized protein LOC106153887 [Lingula anatina]
MNAFMLEDARGPAVPHSHYHTHREVPSPSTIHTRQASNSTWQMYSDLIDTETPRGQNIRMNVILSNRGMVELDLSNRDLVEMPTEVFNFTRIEVFKMANNRIQAVPPAIAGLHRLRIFDMHMNQVSHLPDTLTNLHYLQEMDFSFNKLRTLPQNFNYLQNLKVLKLRSNKFESAPHQLGHLVNLRVLDLQMNSLWHLPFSMQNMRGLRWLSLGNNMFENLPIVVCNMRNLEVIILKNNKLTNLPNDLENLKFLKELNLAGNRFVTVPRVLLNMKSVRHLNLARNLLKSLPHDLSKMEKLRTLHVQRNQLHSIPNNLPTVEYLNVAQNMLRNFSVSRYRNLRYINANNNQLENLPLGLCGLPNVEVIKVCSNQIRYVSLEIAQLRHLRTLDLGFNLLVKIPEPLYNMDLEYFNIRGNPISTQTLMDGDDMEGGEITDIDTLVTTYRHNPPRHTRNSQQENGGVYDSSDNATIHMNGDDSGISGIMENEPQQRTRQNRSHGRNVRSRIQRSRAGQDVSPPRENGLVNGDGRASPVMNGHVHPEARAKQSHHHPAGQARQRGGIPENAMLINGDLERPGSGHRKQTQQNSKLKFSQHMDNSTEPYHQKAFDPRRQVQRAYSQSTDYGLLGVANQVEAFLNEDLLQPVISHRSVHPSITKALFKREMEDQECTLLSSSPAQRDYKVNHQTFLSRNQNGLLRLRADCFRVTKAGGLFRSTVDPNIKVYFPANAVNVTLDVILQIEKVDQEALLEVKKQNKIVDNIISLGHIIHLGQSKNVNFNEQVTLTIPAPPTPKRGKLQILTYKDDNTCVPSTTGYRINNGYITIQAWHFCGRKGAVLTKSRCKYKACKSVEQFLKHMYI